MQEEMPNVEDLLIDVQSARQVESEPGFQSPEEVREWLMGGNDLFNPVTYEYVYHDMGATDEFVASVIDLDAVEHGDIFEGYHESWNHRINADEFCQRVVSENGWGDISTERVQLYRGLLVADALWIGQGFHKFPLHGKDAWRCRTDKGDAFLFIPRRGERWQEPRPAFDVPMLNFVRANGVPKGTAYTMDISEEGVKGEPIPHRVPQGSELPEIGRYWAARVTIAVVLEDSLIKNNRVMTKEYGEEYARRERENEMARQAEPNRLGGHKGP